LEPGLLERISAHYVEEIIKTLSHA
jgi:hypothetical protein